MHEEHGASEDANGVGRKLQSGSHRLRCMRSGRCPTSVVAVERVAHMHHTGNIRESVIRASPSSVKSLQMCHACRGRLTSGLEQGHVGGRGRVEIGSVLVKQELQ